MIPGRLSTRLLLAMCIMVLASSGIGQACEGFRLLVFSKTTGFRHDAQIQAGVELIRAMGEARGFAVDASEDAALFNASNLSRYAVVVFLNTTGEVLDANQEFAFEQFMNNGGGFVGIHSATDTEYSWPFYGDLVGAYFDSHPPVQDAILRVVDGSHPSTAHLAESFVHRDEWYNFRSNPADDPDIRVLLELDESSYSGGNMGDPHPIAWYQELPGGGRSFYTAMGHSLPTYAAPFFKRHLLGAILFAAGSLRPGTICLVEVLGAGSGLPALDLSGELNPASMLRLDLQGGDPGAAGLLFLSSCGSDQSVGPYALFVDLLPGRLQLTLPFVFDPFGSLAFQLPSDVLLPASLGKSFFMQAAQIENGLGLSNGLELQVCR